MIGTIGSMPGNKRTGGMRALSFVAFFNICVLWGTSNLVTKIGVGQVNTTVFACLRFLFTGLLMLLAAIVRRDKWARGARQWGRLLVISLLMNYLTNGCVVLGNQLVDSGVVTLMLATVPIFTTLIDSVMLKNYLLGKSGWLGLAGGFLGIAVIVSRGQTGAGGTNAGLAVVLLGALCWSVGSIFSKGRALDGAISTHVAAEALFASLLFFITGLLTGDFVPPASFQWEWMAPIVYLAVEDSMIGFLSYIYLLKIWPPAKVCVYAYVNPVVSVLLGALVLGEAITMGKVAGMLIILVSVAVIQRARTIKQA